MKRKTSTVQATIQYREITLKSIREAYEKMTSFKQKRIWVSKKHAKQLMNLVGTPEDFRPNLLGNIGQLYGMPVYIKKYLKKLRIEEV